MIRIVLTQIKSNFFCQVYCRCSINKECSILVGGNYGPTRSSPSWMLLATIDLAMLSQTQLKWGWRESWCQSSIWPMCPFTCLDCIAILRERKISVHLTRGLILHLCLPLAPWFCAEILSQQIVVLSEGTLKQNILLQKLYEELKCLIIL